MQKLIKLSNVHYIIVDDSEIEKGDKFIIECTINTNYFSILTANKSDEEVKDGRLKVTHSTEPIDGDGTGACFISVKQLPLSEVEEAIYGYSVEKMAKESDKSRWRNFRREHTLKETYESIEDGFILGFNAHKELVKDKLFTVEDMKNAYEAGMIWMGEYQNREYSNDWMKYLNEKDYIQSLLPKTEWDIEIVNGKIKLI